MIEKLEANNLNGESTIEPSNKKWTLFLGLCGLTVCLASFQFGYNISSLNSPADIIKDFIKNYTFLFNRYHTGKAKFDLNEKWLIGNETKYKNSLLDLESKKSDYLYCKMTWDFECTARIEAERANRSKEIREKHNMTIDEYLEYANKTLHKKRLELESYRQPLADGLIKVNRVTKILWTFTNCLFVIGGMIGAFTSKYVLDTIGRKRGILFHSLFTLAGGVLVLIAPFIKSPMCVIISRFLFGIQGGMCCSLVPTYLNEIAPSALRGQIGVMSQLCITFGILVAQLLGFRQILGHHDTWNYLLAFPLIPAVISMLFLFLFFSETPKALLLKSKDYEAARKVLQQLRNTEHVNQDIQEIYAEATENKSNESFGIKALFSDQQLIWPLITSVVICSIQQFSGINAVFFYSSDIFKDAGISSDNIQYAILLTGVVNILATFVCIPLIEKLGRKPLLVYPMAVMLVDFILLTAFLALKDKFPVLSYLSILCILVFVISFALGLGPIPFIYCAEVFRQDARSTAMAIGMLANWTSGLILTLAFPFLQSILVEYVFLIFFVLVGLALLIIVKKMPETKGKSIDEIIKSFKEK